MKHILSIILVFQSFIIFSQNPLVIPPALTGTVFNLNVQMGKTVFYDTTKTPTFGINGNWMSPTIIVHKNDVVTLNVTNQLNQNTTMHWHGLHVAPENDGGPHQSILPNKTWSPTFKILNNASTFWYHPHGAGQTDPQVSRGLAGLFIIKDSLEEKLPIPQTYGVDDIPLIVQSKAFDKLKQIAIATDMDTALFVNGTLHPYFDAPAQVLRFRMLNGSSLRTFNFGLSNNQSFYKIGTDGGLLDSSVEIKRLMLSPGERAEILVDFSDMLAQTIFLKSYASEMPLGVYGSPSVGNGADTIHDYTENFLNGADFDLLQINVVQSTNQPIKNIVKKLVPYFPFEEINATHHRAIVFDTIRFLPIDLPNRAEGPFGINNTSFDMNVINETVILNTTEIWTIHNKTLVAHPFHIHDIQFNIIERNGLPIPDTDRGWKDVVLVMPNDSIKFITKFETFSNNTVPYMYHCHLLHHEDDGMMGTFVVIDTTTSGIKSKHINNGITLYPNPVKDYLFIKNNGDFAIKEIKILNTIGQTLYANTYFTKNEISLDFSQMKSGFYFIYIKTNQGVEIKKVVKD